MTPKRSIFALIAFLALLPPAVAAAEARQEPTEPGDMSLHSQLERLNANIERIATLLERSLEGQQLELLIQRVEMGADRLAVAEKNLRDARATRANLDDERLAIEARLEQMADGLESGLTDMPLEELEQFTRELDLQLKLLKERLRVADREIIELENEALRQRDHIRDWQDYIDRELTARQ